MTEAAQEHQAWLARVERSQPVSDGRSLTLQLGPLAFKILGLDEPLKTALEKRWDSYLNDEPQAIQLQIFDAGSTPWLEAKKGEVYRLEHRKIDGQGWIVSYGFICRELNDGWQIYLARNTPEPADRILENVVRAVFAKTVAARGGLALHGATVEHHGRAVIFAGLSNAGKSTAVKHSKPKRSLGDDYAVAMLEGNSWMTYALPFDNQEVPACPPEGPLPIARIYLLEQSKEVKVLDNPSILQAQKLMGVVPLTWTYPELQSRCLDAAIELAQEGLVKGLRLRNDPSFWDVITDDLGDY